MTGLYFYKLVSPFSEDVTKDCKLTVNEIDHNFMTLKESDVAKVYLDDDNRFLVLETKSGDTYKADVSHFAKNVSINFDKETGNLEINHDGVVETVEGLVTKDNITTEIVANIITDATLVGRGTCHSPMGLSSVEKTSAYKPAIKVIDKTQGAYLPKFEFNKLGDRYITYEDYNEYGYLYNYRSALCFTQDIHGGWRIPTKEDWDNMLNAIEPCDTDKNHDAPSCNIVLGKFAGKFLKSQDKWVKSGHCDHDCPTDENCDYVDDGCDCHDFDDCHDCCHDHDCDHEHDCCHPHHHHHHTHNGIDSYGMRILPAGYGDGGLMMDYFGRRAKFWTSTQIQVTNMYVKRFDYDKCGVVQVADNPRSLASVRLVKDYDGSNYREIECIGGVNYRCVLMPAKNTTHGYLIWMASNLAASQKKYNPVEPNGGENLCNKKVFYINEWNGFDWVKKEINEGDSLIIKIGPDGECNNEYRLTNGQFVNIKQDTISSVINKYDPVIDELNGKVEVLEDEVSDIKDSIVTINDKLSEHDIFNKNLEERLNNEIKSREEVDTQMWEALNNEISARTDVDNQIWVAINNEASDRSKTDKELWDAVNSESFTREETDNNLWKAINNEISARTDVDTQMWEAINNEAKNRELTDTQIWTALNNEISARTEVDTQIWGAIDDLKNAHEDGENALWDALNKEIERSVEQDKRLLSQEGSTFDCANGILTLKADDSKYDITIEWDANYGAF